MPKIDHDTKEKILAAAEKVFHHNGFKGTRTTQIAEESGISRTMLHYYFKSKEDLFQEVLKNTVGVVLKHTNRLISEENDLFKVIDGLIDIISAIFEEKPGLATFIVNIMNESPDMAYLLANSQNDDIPKQLENVLKIAKQKGEVSANITGEDLILDIYALCCIPYLGSSYIKVKEKRNDVEFKQFINERKVKVKNLILKGIKP